MGAELRHLPGGLVLCVRCIVVVIQYQGAEDGFGRIVVVTLQVTDEFCGFS